MSAHKRRKAVLAAIELFGSEWKLAEAIGYSQHAVWRAKNLGRVSPRMATAIHRATGGKIKRHVLCPMFDPPIASSEIQAAS